jgi:hypothetical protein
MAISVSTIKALCTQSEAALVKKSRQLEAFTAAELKKLSARTRKLSDKWHALARGQSRARGRESGFGEAAANTKTKAQIFRDALERFEARLSELGGELAAAGKRAGRGVSKRERSAEHRARRAAVRKGLTAAEDLLNAETRTERKPPAKAKPAAKPVAKPAARKAVAKAPAKAPPVKSPPGSPKKCPIALAEPSVSKQRAAAAAAKQARIARTGRTTRMAGHVGARTRRAQGRRDSLN